MRKRNFNKLIFSVALAAASLSIVFFGIKQPVNYENVQVSRVVDGDTIELSNGNKVRLIGIDTPELEKNTATGWVEVNQPFAKEAKQATEELVLGKQVRLEFDVQRKDKYNRLLAYCFIEKDNNNISVEVELLRRGLAYLYTFPPNIKYVDVMVEALKEAREKHLGLWPISIDIESQEAYKFLGERKMVSGLIKRANSTAKTIRLRMDGLLVVIFKNDLVLFEKEGIDPALFYKGKKVRVFGLIKEYQGEPEIIVSNPWQIEII